MNIKTCSISLKPDAQSNLDQLQALFPYISRSSLIAYAISTQLNLLKATKTKTHTLLEDNLIQNLKYLSLHNLISESTFLEIVDLLVIRPHTLSSLNLSLLNPPHEFRKHIAHPDQPQS